MSYIARTQTKVKYTAVSRETKEPKFHVKLQPVRSPHATRRRQRVASTTRLCRSLGDTPGTRAACASDVGRIRRAFAAPPSRAIASRGREGRQEARTPLAPRAAPLPLAPAPSTRRT